MALNAPGMELAFNLTQPRQGYHANVEDGKYKDEDEDEGEDIY